mgnify:CR=1 FL=1
MKKSDFTAAEAVQAIRTIPEGASAGMVEIKGTLYAVKPKTVYVSAFLVATQAENGQLLIQANKRKPGLRNFDSNMLPDGTLQLVHGVRILSANALAGNTDADLQGAAFEDKAKATVYNGELKFTQNQVLAEFSGSDVCNKKASTGNDDDFRSFNPFLLRDQVETSIVLTGSGTAPAANDAIKLEYRCLEFVKASRA